ncbi:MAG: cysteine--tRNA ligase [Parcubacteria group bacterium]|nr:cysteine--tRNA ligase [Parcubacteria group bacterium]
MSLVLHNTLHGKKEPFTPLNPPDVGFYSCGPTVYHYVHIGNLRAYTFADVLKRVLLLNGYQVNHIMNITDVGHLTDDADDGEDKMEKGARREGKTVWDVAQFFTDAFLSDAKLMNLLPPLQYTKATNHIPEQIALIKQLEGKGFTYVIDDGVYYDTSKFPGYGSMAKLDIENLKAGARVEINDQKRNITDFALWKFSPVDQKRGMEWESPWGKGFPGWHIECSAMAMKYLGNTFDIHTGGRDLIPVHHTNEIAQSEGATGKPFVRYWLHNEFVVVGKDEKMSKSADNFLRLQSIIDKGYDPLDYRFLCLNTHYRSPLSFSWAAMDAGREGRERLNQFVRRVADLQGTTVADDKAGKKYLVGKEEAFLEAVNDDLNTPAALGIVFDLVKDINSQIANNTLSINPADLWALLLKFDQILGLKLDEVAKARADLPVAVQELLARRLAARQARDFTASDRLRDEIKTQGYLVEDTSDGQKVRPL